MPNMRFTRGGRMLYREISKKENAKKKEEQKMNEPLNNNPLLQDKLNAENKKKLHSFKIGAIIISCLLFVLGVVGLIYSFNVLDTTFVTPAVICLFSPILAFILYSKKEKSLLLEQDELENQRLEELRVIEERHTEESFNKIVNVSENNTMETKSKIPYDKILKPDETLLKQFQKPIYNYIEMMYSKEEYFFNPSFFHFSSDCFTYPLNDEVNLLCRIVNRDGVKNEHVQKSTSVLVDYIHKELYEKNYYEKDLCPVATYGIIRYFIIKYFHDKYVAEIGYPTYQEYCENTDYYSRNDSLFFFFKQYEDNIYAPLEKTYNEFHEKIKYYQAEFEKQNILTSLLNPDNSTTQNDDDMESYFNTLSNEEDNQSKISLVDRMDGRQFELYIAELFKKKGYKAVATKASGDFGIDVIVENDLMKIGIQVKCYSDKVSNSAVQEAVTAKKHYGLDKVMVITNNYFTPSAIQLAKDNNVTLWNRDRLIKEIDAVQ